MDEDVFRGVGVEVALAHDQDFLKVKETLTRMGIASKRDDTLFQSCHILHKRGRYAILHFKELFILDGKTATLDESDIARRNTIVKLLSEWELLTVLNENKIDSPVAPLNQLKIIPHKEKNNWTLVAKYSVGKKV